MIKGGLAREILATRFEDGNERLVSLGHKRWRPQNGAARIECKEGDRLVEKEEKKIRELGTE